MYEQHVTRGQWEEATAHLSAVEDAPHTESEVGVDSSVPSDAGSAYVDGADGGNEFADNGSEVGPDRASGDRSDVGSHLDGPDLDQADLDKADLDETDLGTVAEDSEAMPFVAESVPPAKPFLSLVAGFDELFEEIEDQWQERALCAQTDPEAFFPEKGGSTREAKRICLGCEVKDECLEYALANDERFGIWGGLSERERRRLKRGIG